MPKRPIESTFPIAEVNRIVELESTGFGRRHYRPVYVMHKWWARRLGSVFRTILLYSLADPSMRVWDMSKQEFVPIGWNHEPDSLWPFYGQDVLLAGPIVLDPMMGGGTTIVEALRLGCKVIGGDINPVAWFVVKKEIEDIDPSQLERALADIEKDLGQELRKYYTTTCPICGDDAQAIHYFWVKEVECPDSGDVVPLMRDHYLAKSPTGNGDVVVCPDCGEVFETRSANVKSKCPRCSKSFVPKKTGNATEGYYICPNPSCGKKSIIQTIKQRGSPSERIYAIEFYCEKCHAERSPRLGNGRGYKSPDKRDHQIFAKAKKEFLKIDTQLPIPESAIPQGVDTMRPLNHGYQRFRDMFNARQLLNLGKIYRWILAIQDWNLKEFLVLAFSNALKYNNTFCKYNGSRGFITDIFRTHSLSPSMTPVEANCYDMPRGRGSFTSFVNLVIEGKEYCQRPFERVRSGSHSVKIEFITPIQGSLAASYDDLMDSKNALLVCGTSERMEIPSSVADAVVTDPPYYGNVMYSELSNFFYSWIRIGLKERYEYFRGERAPWRREVIENRAQGKGKKEFLEGLTSVFSESRRILKDDGILAFTFHHKEAEAWGAVLQAILDSGFVVTAIYPVRSEMKESTHIYEMANIEYDMVIVCRKRKEQTSSKSWNSIEATIGLSIRELVKTLENEGQKPTTIDIFVMALGKCLEEYSKYYPNVRNRGEIVGVSQAIDAIRGIVDAEIAGGAFEQLRTQIDETSAVYITYVVGSGGRVSYSAMDLTLKPRGFDIDTFLDRHLAETDGSQVAILTPMERRDYVEALRPGDRIAIDRAHYLVILKEEDRLLTQWREWTDEKSLLALEALADVINSREYRDLASYLRKKLSQETLAA